MTVRHVTEINGAYYFQAPKRLRAAGISSEPLGRDRVKALARAEYLNGEWDKHRRGEGGPPPPKHGSMRWLVIRYEQGDDYRELSDKTKGSVDPALAWIVKHLGGHMAAAFGRRHVKALFKEQRRAVSLDFAHRIVRELRKLFTLAMDEGLRVDNPAQKLRLPGAPARDQSWPETDLLIFVATADALGRASIGDAALLMYELAHSPIDARTMPWTAYVNGVFRFRRSKTHRIAGTGGRPGKLLAVPASERLAARLEQIGRGEGTIVVSEGTGEPYTEQDFVHWFAYVRWVADLPAELKAMDLRRSRSIELGEAGATGIELAAVTGQSIDRSQRILDTYVPPTEAMARAAIDKGEARRRAKNGTRG